MKDTLIELLGLDPADAKNRAEDLATRLDLTIVLPGGIEYRYPLDGWESAREKLSGRFRGDNRHPTWQQSPILIEAQLPSLLSVLISTDKAEAASWAIAAAHHASNSVPAARLCGMTIIWTGMQYQIFCRGQGGH
jgi:hypothetical protein